MAGRAIISEAVRKIRQLSDFMGEFILFSKSGEAGEHQASHLIWGEPHESIR
jgi:hypothetical protein